MRLDLVRDALLRAGPGRNPHGELRRLQDQATAGTGTYTYDALGRLTAVTPVSGAGRQLSYVGDTGAIASGGTTAYTWDPTGTSLFAAGNSGGGSGPLALANAHGDVTGQYSPADTTLTKSRAYDPWGAVTAAIGTMTGSLGYQSALTDPATGKDLMGAAGTTPPPGTSPQLTPSPSRPSPAPPPGTRSPTPPTTPSPTPTSPGTTSCRLAPPRATGPAPGPTTT